MPSLPPASSLECTKVQTQGRLLPLLELLRGQTVHTQSELCFCGPPGAGELEVDLKSRHEEVWNPVGKAGSKTREVTSSQPLGD